MHRADAVGVERLLHGVGDSHDGGTLLQVRGEPGAGQVDGEDLEPLGQRGRDGGEVAAGAAHAVQQQEGLPGAGSGQG